MWAILAEIINAEGLYTMRIPYHSFFPFAVALRSSHTNFFVAHTHPRHVS